MSDCIYTTPNKLTPVNVDGETVMVGYREFFCMASNVSARQDRALEAKAKSYEAREVKPDYLTYLKGPRDLVVGSELFKVRSGFTGEIGEYEFDRKPDLVISCRKGRDWFAAKG